MYLGRYQSPESLAEYARVVATLATAADPGQVVPPAAGKAPPDLTVDEVVLAFWKYAEQHYLREDGTPTNQIVEYRHALKHLRRLYGHTPDREFGPLGLKTVRQEMVRAGWCRTQVNARVGKGKRAPRWAASEELVPAAVHQALATVQGLQRGRTEAPETEPVGPVAVAHVLATLPHLHRPVAGMVELQLLTGTRPAEVCAIRPCDLDESGPAWVYSPRQHKGAWRGKARAVVIGPRARTILTRFRPADPAAYYFDPRAASRPCGQRGRRRGRRRTTRRPRSRTRFGGRRRRPGRRACGTTPGATPTPSPAGSRRRTGHSSRPRSMSSSTSHTGTRTNSATPTPPR